MNQQYSINTNDKHYFYIVLDNVRKTRESAF